MTKFRTLLLAAGLLALAPGVGRATTITLSASGDCSGPTNNGVLSLTCNMPASRITSD
jgi:hypothetical protein